MKHKKVSTSKTRPRFRTLFQQRSGRGMRCNEEITDNLAYYFSLGLPVEHCCAMVYIDVDSFYRWMKQGKEYLQTGDNEELGWCMFGSFYEKINKAKAEFQVSKLEGTLQGEYTPAWVRDITLLERRDRKNWSKNDVLAIQEIIPDDNMDEFL